MDHERLQWRVFVWFQINGKKYFFVVVVVAQQLLITKNNIRNKSIFPRHTSTCLPIDFYCFYPPPSLWVLTSSEKHKSWNLSSSKLQVCMLMDERVCEWVLFMIAMLLR